MNNKKRILFVVNNTVFFLSHRLPIALGAQEKGYEVHVAALPMGDLSAIAAAGFIFHPIRISQGEGKIFHELATFMEIYRLYNTLKPDLVHNVGIKQVLYGGLAARLARVPTVVNAITGLGYSFVASGLKPSLIRLGVMCVFRLAFRHSRQRLIVQNPDDKKLFVNSCAIPESEVILIRGSGVDMSIFTPADEPEGAPLVILASRMLWDKGVREFVEAAFILKNAGEDARFVLIGETDIKNPTAVPTEQLAAWQEDGVVEWWGQRQDMPNIFSMSHIVCLPSYYREGVPKVLIEAAASGKAIITTDEPGCREIVIDGENGLLISARDSKVLASAIIRLIRDPALRQQMGTKGRELAVAEFSVEKVVVETMAVYESLLCR